VFSFDGVVLFPKAGNFIRDERLQFVANNAGESFEYVVERAGNPL